MTYLSEYLDRIANNIEQLGFIKEAYQLDVISNTLDREVAYDRVSLRIAEMTEKSDVLDNLRADTILRVYHGTNTNGMKEFLMNGVDATKVHYRYYNQGRERGLYVTRDIKTARSFGNWVLGLDVKGKDLYPTARWGLGSKENRSSKYIDEITKAYKNSIKPLVSYQLSVANEPQAMFIGFIPVRDIKEIYNFDYSESGQPLKQYTIEEAKKILDVEDDFDWNINMTADEILQKISEITGHPVEKLIEVFSKHSRELDRIAEYIHIPRKLFLRLKQDLNKNILKTALSIPY